MTPKQLNALHRGLIRAAMRTEVGREIVSDLCGLDAMRVIARAPQKCTDEDARILSLTIKHEMRRRYGL